MSDGHDELSRLLFTELHVLRDSMQTIQRDITQLRERLAEQLATSQLVSRIERDLDQTERRVTALEHIAEQQAGVGRVLGGGGRWLSGILGALVSAIATAAVIQWLGGP